MNSRIFGLLVIILFSNCGGSDDDSSTNNPIKDNTAPSIPSQVFPLNNTICTDNNLVFQWNASTDAEGNRITYKIEVAENISFSPILFTETSFSESKLISLTKGKSYYWRIKSIDSNSAESQYSPIIQFLTEGDGVSNHLPFPPSLVSPALNSEIDATSTMLSWLANDVDGDSLNFDVYLDANSDPTTKVSENQSVTNYNASGLAASSTYFFKVVVNDNKGGVTVGQVWSFTTK